MCNARALLLVLTFLGFPFNGTSYANEPSVFELTIKDHVFTPDRIEVPANKKIKLQIKNLDNSAEEFESYELNREKIIAGNGEVTIYVGPLDPGTYAFFGEFHQDTAQGALIAK